MQVAEAVITASPSQEEVNLPRNVACTEATFPLVCQYIHKLIVIDECGLHRGLIPRRGIGPKGLKGGLHILGDGRSPATTFVFGIMIDL